MLLFTVVDAIAKYLAQQGYSTVQLLFCRSLFAFVPILLLMRAQGSWRLLGTRRPVGHLLRALVTMGALLCLFYAYRVMPLADAYALSFSAPLFMTALSVPLLGERVGVHRWSAVVVGFIGVLVMVRPGAGMIDPVALVVLLGAFLYALAIILVRALSATEASLTIVFYFSLFSALISGAVLPFLFAPPADWRDGALMVALGLVGGVAQLLLTHAYRLAPVAVIAPFDYTAMLWAVLIGVTLFGDVPGRWILIGSGIVIASGIYIVHREASRRASATEGQPAAP